jgi:hypothetical protein
MKPLAGLQPLHFPGGQKTQNRTDMQKTLSSVFQLALSLVFALAITASAQDATVDPVGTWKWSIERNGQTRETTLKIKKEGDKLAGTITGFRAETENKIEDVKVKGDEVTFKVTRETQNGTFTSKYTGKISGDVMKVKMAFERNGETQTREYEAKREKAKDTK